MQLEIKELRKKEVALHIGSKNVNLICLLYSKTII